MDVTIYQFHQKQISVTRKSIRWKWVGKRQPKVSFKKTALYVCSRFGWREQTCDLLKTYHTRFLEDTRNGFWKHVLFQFREFPQSTARFAVLCGSLLADISWHLAYTPVYSNLQTEMPPVAFRRPPKNAELQSRMVEQKSVKSKSTLLPTFPKCYQT